MNGTTTSRTGPKENGLPKNRLAVLFVFVIVDLMGYGLILPLLPYYAADFGTVPVIVGLLTASNAAAQLIGAPLIGRLSDRYGRRPLLIFSIAGTILGFVILGLAEPLGRLIGGALPAVWAGGDSALMQNYTIIALIFASRILDGLLGGNISLAQAYISDVTDEKNRARGLGIIGAAFGLGFIVGPAAGGFLSRWGYSVPAFAGAGLSVLNLIWVLVSLPESLAPERRAELAKSPRTAVTARAMIEALRRPLLGTLLHIRLFYALGFTLFQANFTLYAQYRLNLSSEQTGYILAYVGLLAALIQGLAIGRLTARFCEKHLIFGGVALMAVSLLAWALVPNVWLLLVVLAPMALAAGVLNTVLSSALTKAVYKEEVGGTLGFSAGLQSLAQIASPAAGGALLQSLGPASVGLVGAALMGWLATFVWRRFILRTDLAPPCPDENLPKEPVKG